LKNHHAITTALGAGAEVDDLDPQHRGIATAHGMEEARDPNPQDRHTTMKMMKYRWERHVLLTKFT
jgi:hypothetical protein